MRKLIVQQWVTLDNFAAEKDGGLGFVTPEPFDDDVTDNPFQNELMGFIDSVDTLILGATTYGESKDGWPTVEGAYARKLNGLTKFVASSTLDEAPWGDFPAATVTRDPVATVRELKERDGKDLWLWGSLTLMGSLLDAGVVDEIRMLVWPVALGEGRPLFASRRELKPLEATAFDGGVVLLRYAVTG